MRRNAICDTTAIVHASSLVLHNEHGKRHVGGLCGNRLIRSFLTLLEDKTQESSICRRAFELFNWENLSPHTCFRYI